MKRALYILFLISFSIFWKCSTVMGQQNQLSIHFSELPNAIQLTGNDIQVHKFSNTLKISAKGLTQYQGANIAYQFNITLPNYSYNDKTTKTYKNEESHFFDAKKDAAFTLTIGNQTFGTLYRYKESESVLSKIATTDYQVTCKNLQDEKGRYLIQLTFGKGSSLQESSEVKSRKEEQKLTISDQKESKITISNPQPFPPKGKKATIESSSEVWRSNVR